MKKTIIATATILLSVFLLSSAGYSEYALRDRIADGTYIIAKSQLLKEKGEIFLDCQFADSISANGVG